MIAIALMGSLLTVAEAPPSADCAEGRLFAACADQHALLAAARARAKREGKRLLLVHGHDGCVWSRAMIEILASPAAANVREGFVVVPIVASRRNASGQEVFEDLRRRFGATEAQAAGIPQVVLMDADGERGFFVEVTSLEDNHEATGQGPARYGYDASALIRRLIETARRLAPSAIRAFEAR